MQRAQQGVEVIIPSHGTSNNPSERKQGPLSVDEALQFSPMTSAPVFGLGKFNLSFRCYSYM